LRIGFRRWSDSAKPCFYLRFSRDHVSHFGPGWIDYNDVLANTPRHRTELSTLLFVLLRVISL
jgi:hypothetical protein